MILAVTGHRPDRLGGYSNEAYDRLVNFACSMLTKFEPDRILTGMALGWDQAMADAAAYLKLPYVAVIPCEFQDTPWTQLQKLRYWRLRNGAVEEKRLPSHHCTAAAYRERNKWMVDHSQGLLALCKYPGGTLNTIMYAAAKGKPVINLWDEWENWLLTKPI